MLGESLGGEYRNRTSVHGFAIPLNSQSNQDSSVSKTPLKNAEQNEKVSKAQTAKKSQKKDATKSDAVNSFKQLSDYINPISDAIAIRRYLATFERELTCDVMSMLLAEWSAGLPIPAFDTFEDEAESWAALACTKELEAYALAILPKIAKRRATKSARKKLFWKIWQHFTPADQAAFLKAVNEVAA